jgi:hypothetical protein
VAIDVAARADMAQMVDTAEAADAKAQAAAPRYVEPPALLAKMDVMD